MKKGIFLLIFILIVSGIIVYGYFKAVSPGQDNENSPKIEITPQSYDFGDINYGDIVNYGFEVKNSGKSVLEIKRVATSCSCTTAKINQEKINPGETAQLNVRYDSGAMGRAHGKGRQERIIYIKSSDSENPQVEVAIYANLK